MPQYRRLWRLTMGGFYPTSRGFHAGFERKTGVGTIPGGIPVATRYRPTSGFWPQQPGGNPGGLPWGAPSDFPRSGELDPQYGKQPYDRRGMRKSQFWPQTRTKYPPFGKFMPPLVRHNRFPSLPRVPLGWLKYGLPIAAFAIPFFPGNKVNTAGMTLCFDVGDYDSYGFSTQACLPTLANVANQVMTLGAPMTMPKQFNGLLLGLMTQPQIQRGIWKEMWGRWPGTTGQPRVIIPYLILDPIPWLPLLPQDWTPQSPQPYNPNFPRPVWGTPMPKGWPAASGNSPPGDAGAGTGAQAPRPPNQYEITSRGVSSSSAPHKYEKPGRRKRENKYTASKAGWGIVAARLLRAASRVYGGITETVDLLAAIYSALPDEVIARHPDGLADKDIIPFMLGAIWQHRAEIDMSEAIYNIAANAIEDAIWGRYFAALRSVNERGTNVEGFDRELGQLRELFQELHG